MSFMPALRTQVLGNAEEKAVIPIALASYYNQIAQYNTHTRAKDWPVERAIVEGFERVIWVFKSVQSIASDSARLPYQLREKKEVLDDHPCYRVLNIQANPLESGKVFRKRLSGQILLSKRGAFVEVTRSNGNTVKRLDLLPPDRTQIIPGKGDDLVDHVRLTRKNGEVKNIDWEDVLWFRDPHILDPYSGTSPIEPAGQSIQLDHFARLYNVAFMQNDGRPGGVLAVRKTDGQGGDIDETQMDRIERKFSKGPVEAGKLSVIAGDLSYVDIAAKPRDMQYGATARNAKIETLAAFGVSETVLGYAADRTFDNADAELYNYWTRTMPNHNDILLDGFSKLSDESLEGFFDTSGVEVLERADRQRRAEARTEVESGLRSIWSYYVMTDRQDEIEETPHTRALYVPQGKTPLPSKMEDMEALGLGAPPGESTSDQPAPAATAGAVSAPAAEPLAIGAGDAPAPPDTGTDAAPAPVADAAPSGAARAALESLASTKRLTYRIERKAAMDSDLVVSEPALASADALETAVAQALRQCAERWAERAAARVESPKQRKHTRHWEPEYARDTRIGTKALDASRVTSEQTWQAEAEETAQPLVQAAAIGAAVLLLADLGFAPPLGLSMTEWARRMVVRPVLEVVSFIGRSAAGQASALTRGINIADQQGDSIDEIVALIRERASRLNQWADGLATQVATATVNGARDAASQEVPDPVDRVWTSRRDDRVRHTHQPIVGADGQIRAVGEPFVVGTALLMRPGDPLAPLRETAGCRCYLRHRRRKSGRWAVDPSKAEDAYDDEVEGKARGPVDGDGDGFIYDGTPRMRAATPTFEVPALTSAATGAAREGRREAVGTVEDPIDVNGDFDAALTALAEGKHVRLNRVDEVGTLLDKMAAVSAEASSKGERAPLYDLCRVSVPGTNLFCHDTVGVPRAEMPQLSGDALPGSLASALPTNPRGRVDAAPLFLEDLRGRGVDVTETEVPAAWLKASQNQLNGAQVAYLMSRYTSAEGYHNNPIFVTRDGYVIDGHHRWAAKVGIDARDNALGEVMMPVRMIDMEIGQALAYANDFSRDVGIAQQAMGSERPVDRTTGLTNLPDPVVAPPRA